MDKKCIACGGSFRLIGKSAGVEIYKCVYCGLGVTSGAGDKKPGQYHRDWVYAKREKQFRNIFQKRADIVQRFGQKGNVLEIGSSTGILLSLLKQQGWDVAGIEPSREAASMAKKRGVPTTVLPFERAKLTNKKYDVVIFNHTLEHMTNPLTILKKARSMIKAGGILFIDVPNFASLGARVAGVSWKYILPNEHIWHFTPSALFNLLNKADFRVVWWEARSGVWDYASPIQEIWDSFSSLKFRFFNDILTAIPSWLATKAKLGTSLSVIAIKK